MKSASISFYKRQSGNWFWLKWLLECRKCAGKSISYQWEHERREDAEVRDKVVRIKKRKETTPKPSDTKLLPNINIKQKLFSSNNESNVTFLPFSFFALLRDHHFIQYTSAIDISDNPDCLIYGNHPENASIPTCLSRCWAAPSQTTKYTCRNMWKLWRSNLKFLWTVKTHSITYI